MSSLAGPQYSGMKLDPGMASARMTFYDPQPSGHADDPHGDSRTTDNVDEMELAWHRGAEQLLSPPSEDSPMDSAGRSRQRLPTIIDSQWTSLAQGTDGTTQLSHIDDARVNSGAFVSSAYSSSHDGFAYDNLASTVSPSHIGFDTSTFTKASFLERGPKSHPATITSRPSSSAAPSATESTPDKRSHADANDESDLERRSASPRASIRGRKASIAQPGSARALYLEKNRQAARKCRTKQKRQQGHLVETARDMERTNKQLKAEVEILKNDMLDLMGMVIEHSACPDQRLSNYVQREANRIAKTGTLQLSNKEKVPENTSLPVEDLTGDNS